MMIQCKDCGAKNLGREYCKRCGGDLYAKPRLTKPMITTIFDRPWVAR